ncbi:hypothetical protein [Paenibacillus abyssi]|uniref:Uncharacterized protein n=1 Tax=Paenibacillus abyssi TaxID=1340531 RepID=A0A917CYW6_9BACL|nr:hypothetical protein [Paenibacillus abyssi]GGG04026.1 hypothetical protein GCM10010916_21340 [Paenibacillus abyssi]
MPMICEVCGGTEEEAEIEAQADHLHICSDCIGDRQQAELTE